MTATRGLLASERRRHLRRTFDEHPEREWGRYAGDPRRLLARVLRERFLRLHLHGTRDVTFEVGAGPGRFTPEILAATRGAVVAVDLSRGVLLQARRRGRRSGGAHRTDWLQAAAERLPFEEGSAGAVVLLGNIVCMAARDGAKLLREVRRVLRPGGVLVADFASPAGSTAEFLDVMVRRRRLKPILRRPRYYLLDQILTSGFQPYRPARMARWEFQFYTADEARALLARVGFRVRDLEAIAPIGWSHDRVAASARRDPTTWRHLLELEERLGRRTGCLEMGHGFVVAAERT